MARGGRRLGAGAPMGNKNALKHGGRAKVLYGVPLYKALNNFEYRSLCFEQLAMLKELDELDGGWISPQYLAHKERYIGAVVFNERRSKYKSAYDRENRTLLRFIDDQNIRYRHVSAKEVIL